MIGVRTGTQTWSTAPQQVDLGGDDRKTISTTDQDKYFGEQNVGEVLNKIADPNWVDPAKAARKVGNNQLDKDAFMKLLLTQMKHQDPTNPMQSHEMAAQLAQFTSLEKLTNINEGIDALTKSQAPSQNFDALNLIGKAVVADSGRIDRLSDSDAHPIAFRLAAAAQQAEVRISDAEGKVIRKFTLANLKEGNNEITWNGKDEEGRNVPKGTYAAVIEAKASNGNKLHADTHFEGVITGVNFTAQGPMLMLGKHAIPLKDIKEIVDPQLAKQQMEARSAAQVPQKTSANGTKQTEVKSEDKEQKKNVASNLDSMGMSQDLINQLRKSGVKGI